MANPSQASNSVSSEPRWHRFLFRETDVSSIVFLRIAFGLLMFWEVWRFFDNGYIRRYWIDQNFHFKYRGFEWVDAWPGEWMYVHWAVMGVAAVCIACGLLYRYAATIFFLGYTYSFLIEQARYQNHYYLICLVSFLMIFVPANTAFSLDVKFGFRKRQHTIP
ncbi:MAG: HTTM domain-containing protein, partial [Verrucomicrobiales bacterium]|nr:HTTM domain-containing protein [Verrucomicrobiales bacterium]